MNQYAIVIEGDGSTNYSSYAPDLPGVVATGDALEEVEAAMREAIEFHIEGPAAGRPRCPLRLARGSFSNSHRPSSEGTFRVDAPE